MKRLSILLVLAALLPIVSVAERVSPENARKVASNFLDSNGLRSNNLIDVSADASFSNLFVFKGVNGFVVMSADNCVRPILGYSTTNTFEVEGMPDNIRYWLEGYDGQIQIMVENRAQATNETLKLWEDLESGSPVRTEVVVDALIQTRWNQRAPFNNLCPPNCPTGCVATAMAQIMKYWEYPSHGIGSNSYTWNGQTLSADFANTTYDWVNMPNTSDLYSTDEQKLAVATLMYHCGVSVNMNYGSSGSSASTSVVANSLIYNFNYKPTASYLTKAKFDESVWIEMLKNELDAHRPLEYRGSDAGGHGGHAFVCDGYDSDNRFHFNWGWGGNCDGFYTLDDMKPVSGGNSSGYEFTVGQGAVFGIQPNVSAAGEPANLVAVLDNGSVSLTWEAGTNAVSYTIFRNDALLVNQIGETHYVDVNPRYGTNVYYVRSVDADGVMSLISNVVTVSMEYSTPKVDDLVGVIGDDNVQLIWSAPCWCYPENETASLYYTLDYTGNSMGYTGNKLLYWGHRYPVSMLEPYTNKSVYKVSFYSKFGGDYQLFVYQGTDSSKPSTLLRNMSMSFTKIGWCEFVLDEPIIIDGTKDIWVFIYDPVYRSYPACYSPTSDPTNGNYYSTSPASWTGTWGSGAFLIQTFITDGTYTYNLYDGATKIAENLSDTHYLVENPSGNTMHNYAVKTNYYGGETNPSNYVGLTLGNATVDNLELTADDKMVISENGILNVSGTLANSNPANLILEDGAQLVNNSTGVKATVRHSITGYDGGEAKDGGTTIPAWNLIASPFVENITPSAENGLCTDNYDLYRFNQDADLQWENAKSQSFAMENKVGYLYASEEDADVELAGTLAMAASEGVVPLTYTAGKPLAGWNLVGNPYPCNAYPSQSYYTLSADGTSVNPNMTTDAVPPCSAILVKADAANQSVSFSKTEPRRDYGSIVITVFDKNGTAVIGRAMVCFNAGLMSSLQRFPVDNAESKLYLLHDGKEYVITDVEDDVNQQISICFATKNVGNYLISFDMDKLNGKQVVVVDDLTGESRCLSEKTSSFVFAASPDDHPVRFRLLLNNK